MVFVRRPFFHYDPARCGMPTLYGTVSERAAKTIRFNTLWQWKGYVTNNKIHQLTFEWVKSMADTSIPI